MKVFLHDKPMAIDLGQATMVQDGMIKASPEEIKKIEDENYAKYLKTQQKGKGQTMGDSSLPVAASLVNDARARFMERSRNAYKGNR